MTDELLNRVTAKTGLSPDQARVAIETVLAFLREKLTAPLSGERNHLVEEGETVGAQTSGGLSSRAGAARRTLFHKPK